MRSPLIWGGSLLGSSLIQLPVRALFPLLYTKGFPQYFLFIEMFGTRNKGFLRIALFKLKIFLHPLRFIFNVPVQWHRHYLLLPQKHHLLDKQAFFSWCITTSHWHLKRGPALCITDVDILHFTLHQEIDYLTEIAVKSWKGHVYLEYLHPRCVPVTIYRALRYPF